MSKSHLQPEEAPKLTDKQQAFILEYVKDFNATQAAIRAGYAKSGAKQEGHRLLANANIRAEIDLHFLELGITADRILAEQAALAFSDAKDYMQVDEGGGVQAVPLDKIGPGKTRAIKKVKETRKIKENPDGSMFVDSVLEYELHDKQKALEVLGKHVSGRERISAPSMDVKPDPNKQPAQQVIEVLAQAMALTQQGQLDPKMSASMATLAAALLKANEQGDLEERLALLENLLAVRQDDDLGISFD